MYGYNELQLRSNVLSKPVDIRTLVSVVHSRSDNRSLILPRQGIIFMENVS